MLHALYVNIMIVLEFLRMDIQNNHQNDVNRIN